MIKNIQFLLVLLTISSSCISQKVDSDSVLTQINKKITNFFVDEGVLEKSVLSDDRNYVFAYELVEKKVIGYNSNGIYRIGVFQSHSDQYILVKQGSSVEIFTLKEFDLLVGKLIQYRIRNNIEVEKMLEYYSFVIDNFRQNDKKYSSLSSVPVVNE